MTTPPNDPDPSEDQALSALLYEIARSNLRQALEGLRRWLDEQAAEPTAIKRLSGLADTIAQLERAKLALEGLRVRSTEIDPGPEGPDE